MEILEMSASWLFSAVNVFVAVNQWNAAFDFFLTTKHQHATSF